MPLSQRLRSIILILLCVALLPQAALQYQIGIIGGGASGMFAAASAVSRFHELKQEYPGITAPTIVLFEATADIMTKVLLSGGGRCNVLHDTDKPLLTLLQGYPRGRKELQGIMTSEFGPSQARAWFEQRGVRLKTEADGRMFPITDSSQTIVDAIYKAVVAAGQEQMVRMELNQRVLSVERIVSSTNTVKNSPCGYQVITVSSSEQKNSTWNFHSLIFASGSSRKGYELAASLGHEIITPVPSLFTLSTKSLVQPGGVLHDLAGISVPKVELTWKRGTNISNSKERFQTSISQQGPLLITHVGISGPAALRLSAFAAREFHHENYKGNLTIHWIPDLGSIDKVETLLMTFVSMYPRRKVSSYFPFQEEDGGVNPDGRSLYNSPTSITSHITPLLPKRLWTALVHASGVGTDDMTWGEMSKAKIRSLAKVLTEFSIPVSGKGVYKDEFVTAGGICMKGIQMKRMESKLHAGLFFCGEILNVDGVTGGYNFMNCWSTGFVAGKSAMERVLLHLGLN